MISRYEIIEGVTFPKEGVEHTSGLIPDDEPVFLIRSKDNIGHRAVRAWVELYEAAGGDTKMANVVRKLADDMEKYRPEDKHIADM